MYNKLTKNNMKKILFIVIFGLIQFNIFAQNCNQPVSNFTFQGFKRELQNQNSDSPRLNTARGLLNNNCFSASQIKELAEIFQEDFPRLEFAKTAYDKVFDRTNFYEVYNSFAYFSTVFMLHDFVLEKRGNNNNNNNNNNSPNFPNLIYPNAVGYVGASKCNNPVTYNDFIIIAIEVNNLGTDELKINKLGEYFSQNTCFTTAQIMRFATLLQNENNRLNYLKRMYPRSFDSGNYQQAVQTLQTSVNQQNLVAFLQAENGNTPSNPVGTNQTAPCVLSDVDYKDVRDRINKESFNNSKINMARTLIPIKRCFTTQQIRGIMDVITFDKMNIAKFSYDYCSDKQEYYKLSDGLSSNRDREDFMKFLATKR